MRRTHSAVQQDACVGVVRPRTARRLLAPLGASPTAGGGSTAGVVSIRLQYRRGMDPEKCFFAYLRWYSPTRAFFHRSWKMGNIVEVK